MLNRTAMARNGIDSLCRGLAQIGYEMSSNGIVVFRIESQRQGKERLGKARAGFGQEWLGNGDVLNCTVMAWHREVRARSRLAKNSYGMEVN